MTTQYWQGPILFTETTTVTYNFGQSALVNAAECISVLLIYRSCWVRVGEGWDLWFLGCSDTGVFLYYVYKLIKIQSGK